MRKRNKKMIKRFFSSSSFAWQQKQSQREFNKKHYQKKRIREWIRRRMFQTVKMKDKQRDEKYKRKKLNAN